MKTRAICQPISGPDSLAFLEETFRNWLRDKRHSEPFPNCWTWLDRGSSVVLLFDGSHSRRVSLAQIKDLQLSERHHFKQIFRISDEEDGTWQLQITLDTQVEQEVNFPNLGDSPNALKLERIPTHFKSVGGRPMSIIFDQITEQKRGERYEVRFRYLHGQQLKATSTGYLNLLRREFSGSVLGTGRCVLTEGGALKITFPEGQVLVSD